MLKREICIAFNCIRYYANFRNYFLKYVNIVVYMNNEAKLVNIEQEANDGYLHVCNISKLYKLCITQRKY